MNEAKTNGTTEVNKANSPQDVKLKGDEAIKSIQDISLAESKKNKASKPVSKSSVLPNTGARAEYGLNALGALTLTSILGLTIVNARKRED